MIDDPNRGSGRLLPKMPLPPHVKRPAGDSYMPPLENIAAEINSGFNWLLRPTITASLPASY
jgi:hypothetical protein